ncbi:MAG: CRTAC1 family protein [Gimesia sp.]
MSKFTYAVKELVPPFSKHMTLLFLFLFTGCSNTSLPPEKNSKDATSSSHSATPYLLHDVTPETNIEFIHQPGEPGHYFMPEIMCSGGAFLDYDLDGDLDVYLLNGGHLNHAENQTSAEKTDAPTNRLFRQEADGSFVDVTTDSGLGDLSYSIGVSTGDVNNDGYPDVYVTNYGQDKLFLNRTDGTFLDVTQTAGLDNIRWSASSCFFDYDRDGKLDLFVVNYVDYYPEKQCETRQGKQDYCGPKSFSPTIDRLYHNVTPDRSSKQELLLPQFEDVTAASKISQHSGPGLGVLAADLNGDDWPDLYISNDQEANFLWINQQDGTFAEKAILLGTAYNSQGQPQASMGIAYGDTDEDGNFDLFLTHFQGETNALYLNKDSIGFQESSQSTGLAAPSLGYTGFGTKLVDIDQDGDLDLLVVNGLVKVPDSSHQTSNTSQQNDARFADPFWKQFAEPNQIFINDGKGLYQEYKSDQDDFITARDVSRGLISGDIDNDGDIDFMVTNSGGATRIYRNETPQPGNWLQVRAVEPDLGGRDAYGAVVTVVNKNRRWKRLINSASGYLSADDPRAHFGLGDINTIDHIDVIWPDGSHEQFPGGDVNQVRILKHGTGRTP